MRGNIPDGSKWIKKGGSARYHTDGGITYTTKGGTSVRYGSDGFPDFSPHMYRGSDGLGSVRINYTGSRTGDFAAANKAAGFADTPAGYTWHHHQDVGLMQLIQTSVHKRFSHSGGVSVYKASGGKGY